MKPGFVWCGNRDGNRMEHVVLTAADGSKCQVCRIMDERDAYRAALEAARDVLGNDKPFAAMHVIATALDFTATDMGPRPSSGTETSK